MKKRTGLLFTKFSENHKPQNSHPEIPDRLTTILAKLERKGMLQKLKLIQEGKIVDRNVLTRVHDKSYVENVKTQCKNAGESILDLNTAQPSLETYANKFTYEIAINVLGGLLSMSMTKSTKKQNLNKRKSGIG